MTSSDNVAPEAASADDVLPDAAERTRAADLIAKTELTGDEIAFLWAKLQGLRQPAIAAALGWSIAKTHRVAWRVRRRIPKLPVTELPYRDETGLDHGSSLHPAFLQRLESGHRVWSLSPSKQTPRSIPPIIRGPIMAAKENPQAELRAARLQLDKHIVAAQAIEREISTAEENVTRLRDSDDATLLSPEYPARLAEAQKQIGQATARKQALDVVLNRQRAAIQEIEGRIQAGRREAFLRAIGAPERKVFETLESFLQSCTELDAALSQYPDLAQSHVLFRSISDDQFAYHMERLQALNLYKGALNHVRARNAWMLEGFRWHAA
jgi:hypothetical protein